jgi:membrane-associated phospholipid phosphatase
MYGNPSGHSSDAAFVPLVLMLDLFSGVQGWLWLKIVMFGLVYPAYVFFIMFNRLFLGVHGLD